MVLFIVVHNIGVVVVVDVGRALLKKVVLAKVGLCCVFIVLLLLMILLLWMLWMLDVEEKLFYPR